MKLSKSLLAVNMSAAILFSSPATSIGNIQSQTVEAAVTNNCRLNKNAVSLDIGKGTQLTLSNATVSNITWRSSPNIISVDNRGYVKGLKAGSAYVYATYKGALINLSHDAPNPVNPLYKIYVLITPSTS